MNSLIGHTGRTALSGLSAALRVCAMMVDTASWAVLAPLRGKGLRVRSAVEQFVLFGVDSLPIVGLICFLVGAIMAMQASYQLEQFGAAIYIANLVSIAATREMAPLLTAIIITGRSGSAIAAEIGTMKVAEEIDALEVMGLNPTKFLVVPKFLAMVLAVPCVTVLAMFIMIVGGLFVSTVVLGLDVRLYLEQTAESLVMKDMATGLVKSVFFGIVICWVGVYRGFQVEGGAEGVGRQTTSSVVTSIFLIIIVDLIFTALFFFA